MLESCFSPSAVPTGTSVEIPLRWAYTGAQKTVAKRNSHNITQFPVVRRNPPCSYFGRWTKPLRGSFPAELRAIAKLNRHLVFDLLFEAASATLLGLGLDPKRIGGLLGVTAVLHTWTRDLRFHPHLHCIVTGGGWSVLQMRWISGRARYLLPVRAKPAVFRAVPLPHRWPGGWQRW